MIPPEAKNELLMVKNLLKPVKITVDKSKELRPEFEFETLKLKETKSGGDKIIQENSDPFEPEFARIQLRRTPSVLENVETNVPPKKRAKSQRRKIERTEKIAETESRVRSASVPSKKSEESRETDNNNRDDGLKSIKESSKDCFKENYQLEESAEKSLAKLEIPLTYQNVVEQQRSKNSYPPSENNGIRI